MIEPSLVFARSQTTLGVLGHVCVWIWRPGQPKAEYALEAARRCQLVARTQRHGLVLLAVVEDAPSFPDQLMRTALGDMFSAVGKDLLGFGYVYAGPRVELILTRAVVAGWGALRRAPFKYAGFASVAAATAWIEECTRSRYPDAPTAAELDQAIGRLREVKALVE